MPQLPMRRLAVRLLALMLAFVPVPAPLHAQALYDRHDVLHAFVSDGSRPVTTLTKGPDGALYGETVMGGASDFGTIFKVTGDGTVVSLHSFSASEYARSASPLVAGPDGVYGTTMTGGAHASGTVFKVAPSGVVSTIYEFDYSAGAFPGGLVVGPDGALYGVAHSGGPAGAGGVFRVTTEGHGTLLHAFAPEDGSPQQVFPLSVGADGALYGVTRTWVLEFGLVFKVTLDGHYTRLHVFDGTDGKWPYSAPVTGADGAMYGTTARGGPANAGTVYRITGDGTFSQIHAFDTVDGEEPLAPLVPGPDGALYGTTFGGWETVTQGSVFKVSTGGAVSSVYRFTGPDGRNLWGGAPLTVGADGLLYGVARGGGAFNGGVLFSLSTDGAFSVRHMFESATGEDPMAAVVQMPDGALYGVTAFGGPSGAGTVFRVSRGPDATAPTITASLAYGPSDSGWYNYPVVVRFSCSDGGGSGVPEGACPPDQTLSDEGAAVASTAMTVTDAAGNVSEPSNVVVVGIDMTPPVLQPSVGGPVFLNATSSASPGATDTLSGVNIEWCGALDTTTVGTKEVPCAASDNAGNGVGVYTTYSVVYRVNGFQQPINDAHNPGCSSCPMSVFRSGSLVAVKLRLNDANGAVVQAANAPQWLPPVYLGSTSAAANEPMAQGTPTVGTSLFLAGPQYIYNWSTKGLPARSMWRLGVQLADGTVHTVVVGVR